MEDVYHVMANMPNPPKDGDAPITTAELDSAWQKFEGARINRAASFVAAARAKGVERIQSDPEKIAKRDALLRQMWDDQEAAMMGVEKFYKHPFYLKNEVVF